MKNKRNPHEQPCLEVVISHPVLGKAVGQIRDMSERGVILNVDKPLWLKCGHVVGAQIIEGSTACIDPLLSMQVMQVEFSRVALSFVDVSEESIGPCFGDQCAELH